jgi:cytochrome c553
MLAASPAWAGGDAAAGEGKAANCPGCHGAAGEGMGENPKLAGMDEAAFIEAMNAFKSGARENAMMQMFAGQLSEQDFADLAAYYAGLGGE